MSRALDGTELTAARDRWFSSADGERCLDTTTLGGVASHIYLRNRLELAFLAGANAAELLNKSDIPEGPKIT